MALNPKKSSILTQAEQSSSSSSPSAAPSGGPIDPDNSNNHLNAILKNPTLKNYVEIAEKFLHAARELDQLNKFTVRISNIPSKIGEVDRMKIRAATLAQISKVHTTMKLISDYYNETTHCLTLTFTTDQTDFPNGNPWPTSLSVPTQGSTEKYPLSINGGPFLTLTFTAQCSNAVIDEYVKLIDTNLMASFTVSKPWRWSPEMDSSSSHAPPDRFLIHLFLKERKNGSSKRGVTIPKVILILDLMNRTNEQGKIRMASPKGATCKRCNMQTHTEELCGFIDDNNEELLEIQQFVDQRISMMKAALDEKKRVRKEEAKERKQSQKRRETSNRAGKDTAQTVLIE